MTIAIVPESEPLKGDWRPAIISALVALALYALTLGGTYVYDDRYIVQGDPRIADVSRWGQYWTKDYFNGAADNLYRPLVSMSYALQVKLHGNAEGAAWAFHLVNWLPHAAVAAAIAELARRLTQSSLAALIAGVLFAVHPIHVEAVANIVGRAELMCGLGMIGALVLYLRPLTPSRAVAIWLCFLLALLSKEQGMLLPLLLLLAAPLARARDRNSVMTLVLLTLWTLASYVYFRERILKFWWDRSFLDPFINPIVQSRGLDRGLIPIALLGRYVALLIAPLKLCPDYGGTIIGSYFAGTDPYLWLGLVSAFAGIFALTVSLARRAWATMLCLLAFALLFGMVSNLLTIIGVNFGERLMYIPSAFACVLVAMAAARLPRRAMMPIVMMIVLLFCLRTATYAWQWNDRLRLYRYSAEQWPQSVRLRMLYAEELAERGDVEQAEKEISRARDLGPDYYKVWLRSATIAMQAERFDDAMRYAQQAHQLVPTITSVEVMNLINRRRAAAVTRQTTQPATVPATR